MVPGRWSHASPISLSYVYVPLGRWANIEDQWLYKQHVSYETKRKAILCSAANQSFFNSFPLGFTRVADHPARAREAGVEGCCHNCHYWELTVDRLIWVLLRLTRKIYSLSQPLGSHFAPVLDLPLHMEIVCFQCLTWVGKFNTLLQIWKSEC